MQVPNEVVDGKSAALPTKKSARTEKASTPAKGRKGRRSDVKSYVGRLLPPIVLLSVAYFFTASSGPMEFFAAALTVFAFYEGVRRFLKKPPPTEEEVVMKVFAKHQKIIEGMMKRFFALSSSTQTKIDRLNWTIERLKGSMKTKNITAYEIVSNYSKPIKAILLMKFHETVKGEKSRVLKQKLEELGFKHLQGGARILPPKKTALLNINSQEDLKEWIHKNVTQPLGIGLEYVLPFAAVLDMRMIFSERVGETEAPSRRRTKTVFEVVNVDEIDPYAVWSYLEKTHVSIEELIGQGDIVFLASRNWSRSSDILERSKEGIIRELRKATKETPSLGYFSDMDDKQKRSLSSALRKYGVPSPDKVADDIVVEARFWDDFLRSKQ